MRSQEAGSGKPGPFSRAFDFMGRHARAATALLALVCAMSAIGIANLVKYDGDALLMLPHERGIQRSVNYFRSQDAMGKVVISLGLKGEGHTLEDLIATTDELASSLDAKEGEMFTSIVTGPDLSDAAGGIEELFAALPYLMSAEELEELVAPRLEAGEVAARLKSGYLGMFRPGGVMSGSMIMNDPLGLRTVVLRKLSALSKSTGFEITMEHGHFVSADGMHTLILAETSVESTDTLGSRRLVGAIKDALKVLPDYVEADVISGHMHTVSNEDTIKSDIRLTLAIATVGFILLFVFFIGDAGSALIFLVPGAAVMVAVNMSYLILGRLSYMVIGLAAVVAGISVDYAIHVYIATRKGMGDSALSASEAVKSIARPVAYGAFTTVGMFGAFFFSDISGYHQMAVFSIISVLVSLGISLLLLSHIVSGWGRASAIRLGRLSALESMPEAAGRRFFVLWLVITLALGWAALGVELDTDVKALDGTDKATLMGEDRFFDTWGKSRLAVLVGQAPDMDGALRLSERLASMAQSDGKVEASRVSAISTLWPPAETMLRNEAAWSDFWSAERISALKRNLDTGGRPYGYRDGAFEPFIRIITEHSMPDALPELGITSRYIRQLEDETGGSWQVSVFFPDEPEAVEGVLSALEGDDALSTGAYVVSGNALGMMISSALIADMKRMTTVAALAILGLTVFFLRRPSLVLAALVPVLTSTLWLAGGVALMGMKLNVATLVAFIVVMGLCVDYGIFMAHRSLKPNSERGHTATVLAVTLSAASSLIGAGVLVFAEHPALFSVGITLVLGLGSGYLSSLLVTPWLADTLGLKGEAK